jgi:hypothetical protein
MKPHFIIERELNVPRVVVWGGIRSNGVVGLFFFEGNVTVESHLQILEDKNMPLLQQPSAFSSMVWQRDGSSRNCIVMPKISWPNSVWILIMGPYERSCICSKSSRWKPLKGVDRVKVSVVLWQSVIKCVLTRKEIILNIHFRNIYSLHGLFFCNL